MNSFENVGINKFAENCVALLEAQELTQDRAEVFSVTHGGDIIDGLIYAVSAKNEYFEMQLMDGTTTERLDIALLESIEPICRWVIRENSAYKIYVDDIRPVPNGYIGTQSVAETIALIETIEEMGSTIECIDLDHDLGDFAWLGGDAIKVLDYLAENEKFYPIIIHTANSTAGETMKRMVEHYWHQQ